MQKMTISTSEMGLCNGEKRQICDMQNSSSLEKLNIYSIEYMDKNSPPRNIIVTVRKIKKMNVFDALTSFNYQNDILIEKVP